MHIVKNPNTAVDVQLLWQVFPDLLPDGREITHDQVEAVLHEKRVSARYKRVVGRWRKEVFAQRGVYLDGIEAHGRGLVALTPDEMIKFSNRKVRQAGRAVKKALLVAATPDDKSLSEDVRRYRALLTVAMTKIATQHGAALRDVGRALAPAKQLPRARA